MMSNTNFTEIVLAHHQRYPLMQAQDYVKLAYQSAFGCGHMVSDYESALARVKAERTEDVGNVWVETIGNGYQRLYLSGGGYPLSAETVARIFVSSAHAVSESKECFCAFCKILLALAADQKINPSEEALAQSLSQYKSGDFSPVSHTEIYHTAYHPAYRVIHNAFACHIPLISKLDVLKRKKQNAIVAIDGMCASGKTTLAALLGEALHAPVYHMDDFFLPPAKRTKSRLDEPGGNVDYERFKSDVLEPLLSNKPFSFRPFDCSAMDFSSPVFCQPSSLSIVEGSYACHPTLIDHYDFKIFLSVDPALQLERIFKRNGDKLLSRFKNEWIPMETRYFEAFDLQKNADFIIRTDC